MSRPKFRIKKDDTVLVIAGKDRGKVGRVLSVLPDEGRVVIEGIARVKRHVKPVGENPGSIVQKERAIDISNVALWNASESRRVKVAYRTLEDGRKVRVDRSTGAVIDNG
jgi:large subunit ribosomal protein L24